MNLEQLKDKLDEMKTNKAILVSDKEKIMQRLKEEYGIDTTVEAKKQLPKIEAELKKLTEKRNSLIKKAEQFLEEIE